MKQAQSKRVLSRRSFVQSGALIAVACAAPSAIPAFADPAFADPSQATGKPSPVHLGLASYTFVTSPAPK